MNELGKFLEKVVKLAELSTKTEKENLKTIEVSVLDGIIMLVIT
jgi:hypothetical protein